jgi:hypothetical protein
MHELNHKHWSELDALKTYPVKELTSCEFENIIDACDISGEYDTKYDFDKMFKLLNEAILEKAQEK